MSDAIETALHSSAVPTKRTFESENASLNDALPTPVTLAGIVISVSEVHR